MKYSDKDFLQFHWAVSRIQFTQQPAVYFPGIAKDMYCVKLFFFLMMLTFQYRQYIQFSIYPKYILIYDSL